MNLAAARELKQCIRIAAAVSRQIPFATGITCRSERDYRVTILLQSDHDRCFLTRWPLRKVVERERKAIDVEVVGALHAAMAPQPCALQPAGRLKIGASIGHSQGGMGSLGFFASRRSDGRLGVVSCNHVIAMFDRGKDGDAIVSPAPVDGGTRVIASLDGAYPRLTDPARVVADCAFAALHDGIEYDAASVEGGTLTAGTAGASPGLRVSKVGRVTSARQGVVLAVEVDDVSLPLGMQRVVFHDVIVVGAATAERFCAHGDSGALVYTSAAFQPIGLLFATSLLGGPMNAGRTWIHPLQRVTKALNVDLITDR